MLRSVLFGGASSMGSPSLPAIITGMSAFILYTASTLTLRRSATFHVYHVALFWIAFALISASTLLGPVAEGTVDSPLRLFIAVTMPLLPAVHATWALAVWMHPSEARSNDLKSYGTILWASWLIPFSTGLCLGFLGSCLSDIPALALCTTVILALSLCLRNAGSRQDA